MSMQLFSFGHPCEHQLRRTCIGGSSCPLNGYPDIWCCSYIKGKINFKRDKPCEGPRCRWGFTHPSQQQFDAVTQVLSESRPIAAKIDEADDTEILSFHMDNPHIVDTVQCALHMMRHPPSSCARRVGQLLACAAIKSGDAKVFMQLLKTMKKPVDSYILGAYAYLTQGNPPAATNGGNATQQQQQQGKDGKGKKGEKGGGGGGGAGGKKEDVTEELKNGMVDLMNAALSQGGNLVDREDQHLLQATFILALRQFPRSNKRRQEMLEAALAKFGNRAIPKDSRRSASAGGTGVASAVPAAVDPTPGAPAASSPSAGVAQVAVPPNPALPRAAEEGKVSPTPAATPAAVPRSAQPTTPAATPAEERAVASVAAPVEARPPTAATTTKGPAAGTLPAPSLPSRQQQQQQQQRPPASPGVSAASATQSLASDHTPPPAATSPLPQQQPRGASERWASDGPQAISRLTSVWPGTAAAERRYDPIRTDHPLPDMLVLNGLFHLTQHPAQESLLGCVSIAYVIEQRRKLGGDAEAGALPGASGSVDGVEVGAEGEDGPLGPASAESAVMGVGRGYGCASSNAQPRRARERAEGVAGAKSEFGLAPMLPVQAACADGAAAAPGGSLFMENIFGGISAEPVFENLDPHQLFKDFDDTWGSP